jgi:hypothetical protein
MGRPVEEGKERNGRPRRLEESGSGDAPPPLLQA